MSPQPKPSDHFPRWAPVFAAGIFLGIGVLASLPNIDTMKEINASRSWPSIEAEVTGSRLVHIVGERGNRPEFTFRYVWNGETYTTTGFSFTHNYTSDAEGLRTLLNEHPTGSQIKVFVNPDQPSQAVVQRWEFWDLVLLGTPPLFALIGLIVAVFTAAGWLGWLDPQTNHPFGRALRATGAIFLRENVLEAVFFGIIACIVLGLCAWGYATGNVLFIVGAVVVVLGVWNAARKRK